MDDLDILTEDLFEHLNKERDSKLVANDINVHYNNDMNVIIIPMNKKFYRIEISED